jgi:hypothetical protein
MKYLFAKVRRKYILGTKAGKVECRLVGVEWRAGWVQNYYRLRYGVGNPAKVRVHPPAVSPQSA